MVQFKILQRAFFFPSYHKYVLYSIFGFIVVSQHTYQIIYIFYFTHLSLSEFVIDSFYKGALKLSKTFNIQFKANIKESD